MDRLFGLSRDEIEKMGRISKDIISSFSLKNWSETFARSIELVKHNRREIIRKYDS
jgi:hypothetical protein